MALAAPAAPATAAAASPMVVTEQGRVSVGRRPVGVSWIGQEHLLVTSPSQVILYSIHDGGVRLREWSFRPSKATAFSSPALAASQQGLLLGIQGQRRLVAWPDKASLTASGAAGPEAMQGVEVGFPVSRLVAGQGPAGVAWCVGEGGQLACFSTAAAAAAQPGVLALLGASSNAEQQQGSRVMAALPSRRRPLLLVARADGSVSAAAPATQGAGAEEEATTGAAAPLYQYSAKALDPPSPNSELLSSGLMWAGGREDSAYYWTVWSTPAGVRVHVARVSIEQSSPSSGASSSSPTVLSISLLYGKDLGGGGSPSSGSAPAAAAAAAAAAAGRKRRRASVSDNGSAATGAVEVAGLEGEGALLVVDRTRGVLQAWDAEHGVVLGEAAVAASAAEKAASGAAGGDWIAGEGGVLAEVVGEQGEVAVWRAEAREGDVLGGQGGLRRVLGKGAVAVTGPAALGKVLVLSGGEWVEAVEEGKGAGSSSGNGRKGKAQQSEDEVEALLRRLAGQKEVSDKQQQQQGQEVVQDKKWGKPRGPLARTPLSARTALLVARRCLEEEKEAAAPAAATPAASASAASRMTPNKRRKKNGGAGEGKQQQQQQQAPLWRLLGALLDAGKLPLRERPFLMEELLEKGRVDLVRRVLSGPADVPERALVRCLQRALLLPRGPVAGQEQEEGQAEGEGGRVAGLLELVALAVRRPCCPAFLRMALAAEVDGLGAALLLVLLKVLLERAVKGGKGARARPSEEQCLTWLEALLDANFVNLVLEGTAAGSGMLQQEQEQGQEQQRVGGTVRQALEGVKALALEAAGACQALETVGGYVTQFRRAGHAMEVIPDYSVDRLVI